MTEPSDLLQVNPDVIQRLIDLARQIASEEFTEIPEDPEVQAGSAEVVALSAQEFNTTVDEFRAIIDDLDPDQQQQVVALFRLGRGDYTLEEWDDALAEARDDWNPDTADYLLGHPMLAEGLANGMILHGYNLE
jgi:Flp pilus assembly protein TadD